MGKTKKTTAEVRELDIGQSVLAPLDRLLVSPHNVRKTDINDVTGLKASIVEHGLLEALVGYKEVHSPDSNVSYWIAAGQRRLIALQQLAAEGLIAADAPVPVRLVDEVTAIEVSLAENIERKAMNPADETAAFKALVDTGSHDATTIAKRFGFDVKLVRRRLKMATAAPEILDALRAGKITVNSAEAYAATDDHELQLRIFKEHEHKTFYGTRHEPRAVLRSILMAGISTKSGLAKFIGGAKAYAKAGGTLERDDAFGDLFEAVKYSDSELEGRMTDMNLVETLLNAKIASVAKKVEKEVLKAFPFVTGVEWYELDKSGQLAAPKTPKDMVVAQRKYDYSSGTDIMDADVPKLAKKAAEKHGASVIALVTIDSEGQPEIIGNRFFVGKDGWDKVQPKPKKKDERPQLSDEERAALEKEQQIQNWQVLMFGRSELGDTPGFGIVRVDVNRSGYMTLQLQAEQPLPEEYVGRDQWGTTLINLDALGAFRLGAEERHAEREREQEIKQREREARNKEKAAAEEKAIAAFNDVYNKVLDDTVPPEVLVLTDADPDNSEFEVTFVNQGEGWIHTNDETGEEETIDDFSVIMDLISSYVDVTANQPVLTTYETFGGYEAAVAEKTGEVEPDPAVQAYVEEGLGETVDACPSDAELEPAR